MPACSAEVLVTEGQTVAVGTIVARIETDASAAASAPAAPAAPAEPAPQRRPLHLPQHRLAPPAAAPPASAPKPVDCRTPTRSAEERLKRKSTPLVRKMVEEHGLDLGVIPGSGSAGRVTKQDVLDFMETGAPAPKPAASQADGSPAPVAAAPPASTAPAAPAATPSLHRGHAGDGMGGRPRRAVEPHPQAHRRSHGAVASRVGARQLAHRGRLHARGIVRKSLKAGYAERGVNLTFLAFIVKAIADNLRKHPVINAAVSGDNTVFRRDINVGIAVALDWGLIVPVIHHADELSLLGIARAVQDLADRARNRKLAPDEVQKGTFTITNPGGFGTYVGTPVINQPQVAILAIGAIEKRPSVITLPDGSDALGIRTKGMMALAFDHRIVDGADADRFLADVRQTLHAFPEQQG